MYENPTHTVQERMDPIGENVIAEFSSGSIEIDYTGLEAVRANEGGKVSCIFTKCLFITSNTEWHN
jgi:hypothetical protein